MLSPHWSSHNAIRSVSNNLFGLKTCFMCGGSCVVCAPQYRYSIKSKLKLRAHQDSQEVELTISKGSKILAQRGPLVFFHLAKEKKPS